VHRDPRDEPLRLPVQHVLRADGARWYAGRLASGVVRTGDEVVVLPGGLRTTVTAIDVLGRPAEEAFSPQSVAVQVADQVDLARGDVLARTGEAPVPTQDVDATLCWLSDSALQPGARVLVKHATRTTRAVVREIHDVLDVDSLARTPARTLSLNDVGRVTLRVADPLPLDDYADLRDTGSFLVVDEQDGTTLAAGLVGDPLRAAQEALS
jgi:sulfate adenylyltransferase subunit 1